MDSSDPRTEAAVADFLRVWALDRSTGNIRSPESYIALFPNCRDEIRLLVRSESQGERFPGTTDSNGTAAALLESIVGPYLLHRELGRGGQGTVYLAEDTRLHRLVAIKILTGLGAASEVALMRFRREAEVASRLHHPGLCPIYDTGSSRDGPYIVMPYLQGETLAHWIQTQKRERIDSVYVPCDPTAPPIVADADQTEAEVEHPTLPSRERVDELVRIIQSVASALHMAHEAGIVHRDIKPGNILIDQHGQPVLLDFGLARVEERTPSHLTQQGELFGTPPYMAPEQVSGAADRVDERTDIWALGVTLYEAVTCRRPFESPTRDATFRLIESSDPVPPRRFNRAVSRDLQVVITCALSKARRARYQTARAFAEDLGRVLRKEPILAQPVGPIIRLSRWFARNPMLASSVTASFVILIGGIVVALVFASRAQRATVRAVEEREAYDRLADLGRLDDLFREYRRLWPATRAAAPAMRAWIQRLDAVLDRLPEHRERLRALEDQATTRIEIHAPPGPPGDEVRERLREMGDELARLEMIRESWKESPPLESSQVPSAQEELHIRISTLKDALLALKEQYPRYTYAVLGTADAQWRYDRLLELVSRLESLGGDDLLAPSRAAMSQRLKIAESVEDATVVAFEQEWKDVCQAVAADDKLRGMSFEPIPGLIPLGRNEQGYFEFLHWASGEGRGVYGEDGRLLSTAGIVLILLPGGATHIGSEVSEVGRDASEERLHLVTLDPYFISKHEITRGQWQRVMGARNPPLTPGSESGRTGKYEVIGETHPIESVTWYEAMEFATRMGLQLPTEAQWEAAARGGTRTAWFTGDAVSSLDGRTNLFDQTAERVLGTLGIIQAAPWEDHQVFHAPVDQYETNPFGLKGIHGNVSEWCRDRRRSSYPPSSFVPGNGEMIDLTGAPVARVFRDGSWHHPPLMARSATRYGLDAGVRGRFLGFRVVLNWRRSAQ